jgi:V8-like Glu-specific endopeptidase
MRDRARFEAEVALLGEIFTPNSLTRVADTRATPFRWICHVESRSPNGDLWTGTGFLIGPRHVLTSAHVIYPMKDGEVRPQQRVSSINVYPGRQGGRDPFGGFASNGWIIHPQWIAGREANCTFDYGLIRLKKNVPASLGFWGRDAGTRFVAIDPPTLTGRELFTAGYPFRRGLGELAAKVMKESRGLATGSADFTRCSPAGFEGRVSPRVERGTRVLLHDVDTQKGQSGGPIWTRDDTRLTLAAIHYGEIEPSTGPRNVGLIVTQEVFDQVNTWMRDFVERRP